MRQRPLAVALLLGATLLGLAAVVYSRSWSSLLQLARALSHPTTRLEGGELLALVELLMVTSLLLGLGSFFAAPARSAVTPRPSGAKMAPTENAVRALGAGAAKGPAPARASGAEESSQMTGRAEQSPLLESASPQEPAPENPAQHRQVSGPGTTGPVSLPRHLRPESSSRRLLPAVRLEDPEWSRALLGLLSTRGDQRPRAVAFTLGDGAVDVQFTHPPSELPAPFEKLAELRWRLVRSAGRLGELPDTRSVVAASRRAGLVTVARGASSRMLLDVVASKSVALDGPPVAVGATLSDVVVELATRRWSDLDELIVVGFGHELAGLEGVHCLSGPEEARSYLLAAATSPHRPTWGRCIVAAPPSTNESRSAESALRSLVDLVQTLPDTGLVCCDPSIAAIRTLWRLESHRNTEAVALRWPPGGTRKLDLSSLAGPPRDELEGQAPPVAAVVTGRESAARSTPGTPSDEPILVRILGPVDIRNADAALASRRRLIEVIVYLALHPDGCSGEALATGVWPDRRVPTQTVANRLSEARRMLGTGPDGKPRLARSAGRHVLRDIETDWHRFESLTGEEASFEDLQRAIGLIRGRPFEGLSETGWALLEGHIATMEAAISEVGCRAATEAIAAGETDLAEKAVRRCLLASPWDERLYRMLMTACHAAGNRGGVEEALRSLARVLEWEAQPIEAVHPETARLYRRLMSQ